MFSVQSSISACRYLLRSTGVYAHRIQSNQRKRYKKNTMKANDTRVTRVIPEYKGERLHSMHSRSLYFAFAFSLRRASSDTLFRVNKWNKKRSGRSGSSNGNNSRSSFSLAVIHWLAYVVVRINWVSKRMINIVSPSLSLSVYACTFHYSYATGGSWIDFR